ncbi:MAG TPA: VOC family protein [Streptosporangiaceae bacterium]
MVIYVGTRKARQTNGVNGERRNTNVPSIGNLVAVTIDCSDPAHLAEFYKNLLGWEITYSDENAVYLSGSGMRLGFQRVENYTAPQWPGQDIPQQMHLDIAVENVEAARQKVIELGARSAPEQPGGDSWHVMLDPAGHPFDLTTAY